MKKILCPIDFSECSENAVAYAYELASSAGADIVLCFAYPLPYTETESEKKAWASNHEEGILNVRNELELASRRLSRLNPERNIKVDYIIREGLAADIIPNVAISESADIIVMGTKGAEGFRETLGTVSAAVINKVKVPVLVIPENSVYKPVKEIVYATDLEGVENQAVEFTIKLAELFNAHISFLSIQKESDNVKDIGQVVEYAMDNLLNRSSYDNISFHLNEGKEVSEGISIFAERKRADLVVMASYEKSAFDRLFGRSHTREMVYHASIPVLALHKTKEQVGA
ncbi:universal stress protein [Cytophagaceae bacterium ABcell3]|nr:universal stress protein [Cytophagaceae bacterium ABcell3]